MSPAALMMRETLFLIIIMKTGYGWCSSPTTTVTGNNGTFLSPDHPSNYRNDANCLYSARLINNGPQQVRLDYNLQLDITDSCNDYVWIPDLSKKLCGVTAGTLYLSIEGNEFNMTFRSDSAGSGTGFTISFTALEGNCSPTFDVTQNPAGWVLLPITDMLSRTTIVVSVRSCDSVKFVLTNTTDDATKLRRRIVIRSTQSALATCGEGFGADPCKANAVKKTHSQPILDCCQFRTFWFEWSTDSVAVGTGATVGTDQFMELSSSVVFKVRFVHVHATPKPIGLAFEAPFPASYCESPTTFTPPAECMTTAATTVATTQGPCHPVVHLPREYNFELLPITDLATRRNLTMSCQACDNLHIALAANSILDTDYLVIVLGGWNNTVSVIRKNCEDYDSSCRVAEKKWSNLLNCDSFVDLWLAWNPDSIRLGMGKVIGSDPLLSYQGDINDVNYFSMTGWGNTSLIIDCILDAPFPPERCTPSTAAHTTSADITTTNNVVTTTDNVVTTTEATTTTTAVPTAAADTSADITTTNNVVTTTNNAVTTTEATTTTTVAPTAAAQIQVTYTREQRHCTCVKQEVPINHATPTPEEKEEVEEMKAKTVTEIKQNLTLPKNIISATVRRYISAKDDRSSSMYMGVVMGVICFLPLALIVLSDCLALLAAIARIILIHLCSV